MKKFVAMLLLVAMIFTLAACGNKPAETPAADSDKASEPSESTAPAETAEPDKEEADITSWIINEDTSISGTVRWWMPFKGPAGMDALIAEFNEIYPNIKVELTTYNNNADGNMAVNTAIMAGEVDVLASFGLSNAMTRMENGLYLDITDKCEEEGIDLVANWGTDAFMYDDCIYTFPCGGLSYYIAINMTAWNEAGLGELPTEWTWDEYLDACRAMTKYNDDGSVAVYGGSDYHSVNYFTYCYGQQVGKNAYYTADGKASFDSPEIIKALQREYDAEVVEKIWFPKATYRADNIQAQQTFCAGQTASTVICNVTRFLADTENYPVDWITGFAPWPVEEKGQTNYMSGVAPFSHAGICTGCQDEEAAWAFLKFYSTYGVKYLAAAGHQPNWKGTEAGSSLALLFGSEEEAAKIVDIESHNRVVGVSTNPFYYEDELTAYTEINKILTEYARYAINDEMQPAEAMAEAAKLANEAIAAA